MTSLATGFLTPNFTVVIASSYQSRFSVDSVKGNLNITAVATSDSGIYTVEVFPLESAVRKGNVIVMVYGEYRVLAPPTCDSWFQLPASCSSCARLPVATVKGKAEVAADWLVNYMQGCKWEEAGEQDSGAALLSLGRERS